MFQKSKTILRDAAIASQIIGALAIIVWSPCAAYNAQMWLAWSGDSTIFQYLLNFTVWIPLSFQILAISILALFLSAPVLNRVSFSVIGAILLAIAFSTTLFLVPSFREHYNNYRNPTVWSLLALQTCLALLPLAGLNFLRGWQFGLGPQHHKSSSISSLLILTLIFAVAASVLPSLKFEYIGLGQEHWLFHLLSLVVFPGLTLGVLLVIVAGQSCRHHRSLLFCLSTQISSLIVVLVLVFFAYSVLYSSFPSLYPPIGLAGVLMSATGVVSISLLHSLLLLLALRTSQVHLRTRSLESADGPSLRLEHSCSTSQTAG